MRNCLLGVWQGLSSKKGILEFEGLKNSRIADPLTTGLEHMVQIEYIYIYISLIAAN